MTVTNNSRTWGMGDYTHEPTIDCTGSIPQNGGSQHARQNATYRRVVIPPQDTGLKNTHKSSHRNGIMTHIVHSAYSLHPHRILTCVCISGVGNPSCSGTTCTVRSVSGIFNNDVRQQYHRTLLPKLPEGLYSGTKRPDHVSQ
jgi:hypothetical protein